MPRDTEADRVVLSQQVPAALGGWRLDQTAARLFSEYSRARLQTWIREGLLTVDGRPGKVTDKTAGGEWLTLTLEDASRRGQWRAQDLAFEIVHEDAAVLVINKPPGLVVHPGAGNPDQTLLNGLLHHCPALESIPRAGIVHRLDKDTSGLLVVAKTLAAHNKLVRQLKDRSVSRHYLCLVLGAVERDGRVDAPIGRHPRIRVRMAVNAGGKPASTHYRVLERFAGVSYLSVRLETGRTHQIRVHMMHIEHPLVGDPVYRLGRGLPSGLSDQLAEKLTGFPRQALHAHELALTHPETGQRLQWQAPLPTDMTELLLLLRGHADISAGAGAGGV